MSLEAKINNAIKESMRAKEQAKLRALRAVKSAILLAKTEKGASDELSEEKEIQILQKMVKQRKESLEIYVKQNREDLAEKEKEEISAIEVFLPEQMGEEQLKTYLEKVIEQIGATSMKDMGKVMGIANKELAGKADGKMIAQIVKNILG